MQRLARHQITQNQTIGQRTVQRRIVFDYFTDLEHYLNLAAQPTLVDEFADTVARPENLLPIGIPAVLGCFRAYEVPFVVLPHGNVILADSPTVRT